LPTTGSRRSTPRSRATTTTATTKVETEGRSPPAPSDRPASSPSLSRIAPSRPGSSSGPFPQRPAPASSLPVLAPALLLTCPFPALCQPTVSGPSLPSAAAGRPSIFASQPFFLPPFLPSHRRPSPALTRLPPPSSPTHPSSSLPNPLTPSSSPSSSQKQNTFRPLSHRRPAARPFLLASDLTHCIHVPAPSRLPATREAARTHERRMCAPPLPSSVPTSLLIDGGSLRKGNSAGAEETPLLADARSIAPAFGPARPFVCATVGRAAGEDYSARPGSALLARVGRSWQDDERAGRLKGPQVELSV
jgi:hypothetical protein